jgi:hypothetical protein
MSQYATLEDFAVFGLPVAAWGDLISADVERAIQGRSAIVDGLIRARGYSTPLTEWGDDLRVIVCKLAAFDVLVHHRGVNPADPAHAAIVMAHDQAEKALREVVKGYRNLSDAEPARAESGTARVFSTNGTTSRGW